MAKRISQVVYSHSSEQTSNAVIQLVYCSFAVADDRLGTTPPMQMAKGKARDREVLRTGLVSPTSLVVLFSRVSLHCFPDKL